MRVLVIGGGIAGVSAGYYLALSGRDVVLAEQEATLAYHSTGRSAALFFQNYGAMANRPLTRGSREFFEHPPDGLVDHNLMAPRGALWVGRSDQIDSLRLALAQSKEGDGSAMWLEPVQAVQIVPALRHEYLAGAVWEPEPVDLDVAAIHQAFVRGMRAAGADVITKAPITGITRRAGQWDVAVGDQIVRAEVVVNAAGAWCDVVAAMAGARPIGLQPMRRTAFMVPGSTAYADWPLVCDVDNEFYFRPDGVQILCSLADETPTDPYDARPEEIDIALAIERINIATTLGIRTVRSSWAGLRSFAPDRAMVIGFDPEADRFFWLAGQGGTGIQSAPAAGRLTAALVEGKDAPEDLTEFGLDLDKLSPGRFERR
ncbi:MAG: NAD(P)/FAD-dependent oxidoreductase [Gaiellales bacterium]